MEKTLYKVNPREKLFLGYMNEHNARSIAFDGFEQIDAANTVYLAIDGLGMYPLADMSFIVTQAFTRTVGTFGAILCEVRINEGEFDIVHYSPRFQVVVAKSTEEKKEIIENYNPMELWFTKMNSLYQEVLQKLHDGEFKGEPGEPGYTPIKGKDYFDGKNGKDGRDGTDYIITEADYEHIADITEEKVKPILDEKADKTELDDYVKNTDYATNDVGGIVRLGNYLNLDSNHKVMATPVNYAQYLSMGNGAFMSKGTLENVLTGKAFVNDTDYASADKGGVIKSGTNGFGINSNGQTMCLSRTYEQYKTSGDLYFISRGTLENIWSARHVTLTQAEYDALEVKDPMTEYNIVEE